MTSLRFQFAASIAAAGLASGILVGIPLYREARRIVREEDVQRLVGTAESAALDFPVAPVLAGQTSDATARLEVLRGETGLRHAWVVLRDGATVGQRGEPAPDEARALDVAWTGESAWTEPWVLPDGTSVQTAFAPVDADRDGKEDLAIAVMAPSSALVALDDLQTTAIATGLVWLVVLAVGAWTLAGRVSRPLRTLAHAVAQVEAGDDAAAGTPSNVDEVERLRDAISRMGRTVRHREAWLRALAGAVAHEVRNPAHAVQLHVDLLRRAVAPPPASELAGRFDVVDGELAQIEQIVASFLSFARHRDARREPVRLLDLLRRCTTGPVEGPDEVVEVDPVLLRGAVANLVRNAEQAGGLPIVRARISPGRLVITVWDDGSGFAPEIAARVFEPFASGKSDGTGLGLALVSAVAVAHGGSARLVHPGPGGTEVELDIALPDAG